MRVAYVCTDAGIPVFGSKGASVHAQEVIRALLGRGARVALFATRAGGEPPDGLEGVTVHDLPTPAQGERAERERCAFESNGAVREILCKAGPFDLAYERYSLWSYAGMEFARERGIPGLLEVNAPLIEEQAEHRGLVRRDLAEQVANRAFGAATALLAVSREVAAYLDRFPAAAGRVHVVPNGVNPERFTGIGASRNSRADDAFTVGFVGTLKPWHGLPILVEAFDLLCHRTQDARLLVVGEGPGGETMREDLEGRGLLRLARFTGAVPPHEVPGLLAQMDVAVAPYPDRHDFYFSPLKVYEYMAAALPVVASRIGQLEDVLEHGVNGLLCPPGDPEALADALDRLRHDPQLRARLGREARRCVLREHTWDAVAGRILHIAGASGALSGVAEG